MNLSRCAARAWPGPRHFARRIGSSKHCLKTPPLATRVLHLVRYVDGSQGLRCAKTSLDKVYISLLPAGRAACGPSFGRKMLCMDLQDPVAGPRLRPFGSKRYLPHTHTKHFLVLISTAQGNQQCAGLTVRD